MVEVESLYARLKSILERPTGTSSAGFPFFEQRAWEIFRDEIPHLFGAGLQVLKVLAEIESSEEDPNIGRACSVARQIVNTAAITAPPDLWLMRHVLTWFNELGLYERLLKGEAIYPAECVVGGVTLNGPELETDLHFLLARGVVEQYDDGFRIAGHARVRDYRFQAGHPAGMTRIWARAFRDEVLTDEELGLLSSMGVGLTPRTEFEENHWIPSADEIEIGYRLVPLVLALRTTGDKGSYQNWPRRTVHGSPFGTFCAKYPQVDEAARSILRAASWMDDEGATEIGQRGFSRGPGPFGIIETYHGYMERGADILLGKCSSVWVERSANVGASQDANAGTFKQANDALDRFCAETGFAYEVFIEHAIGRGEATRQRFKRSGDSLSYFGADLEDAAIDAAVVEQQEGRLPANMVFVRHADIGNPQILVDAIRKAGSATEGAVMMVGNGFHEVRNQSDDLMVEVFKGYAEAGLILLFTEENALSVDDLRATAYNTYHAGFKYVHEKSGQGLRPSEPRPKPRLGKPLRAPWSECAKLAGYVRMDEYCTRTRTIYPYKRLTGHNPSISVNHFFVPERIAELLKV